MKFDPSIVQARVPSPLGDIAIAATPQGLTGLWFTDNQRYLPPELTGPSAWRHDPAHPVLKQAREQLGEYFAGQRRHFEVPLDLRDPFVATILASIVSLTPGTVSIDVDQTRWVLCLHALDAPDSVALIHDIKQRYEAPLKEIFAC